MANARERAYLSAQIANARRERVAIKDILNAVPVTVNAASNVRVAVARRRDVAAEARP